MTSTQVKASSGALPVPTTKQDDMGSIDPPILRPNPPKKQSKPITPKIQPEIIEIPDDTPPPAPGTPIAEPKPTATEQSPLPSMNAEQPHPKRKASQDEPQDNKRFKRNSFVSPFREISPKTFKEISTIPENSDIPMIRTWLDLNADWHDADIDMFEEFKDIIDFI